MKVPFLDLKAQYQTIQDDVHQAIAAVIERTAFAGGPFVEKFEQDFARFCDVPYAVGVGSGTEALVLALMALNIGPGDEVITVPNSFIATAEAISLVGAAPVFVDVDPETYTMDPAAIEERITEKTRALIPVHLYGQMADMRPILDIARVHNLFVVEDAAQAHGATYHGQPAGSMGDVGCFSFYPGKNLGAYGEAGAVVTRHEEIDRALRHLRDHGQIRKYHHDRVGMNARMDGIQGAVLSVKLERLPEWNEARWRHAQTYRQRLSELNGTLGLPYEASWSGHVYHVFALRVGEREALQDALLADGIATGIHYPIPIHLQPAYADLGLRAGSFPVSERLSCEVLSLPMYPELSDAQIEYVCERVAHHVRREAVVG